MIVYKITNDINDKIYIGQTVGSLNERWRRHTWDCTIKRNAMAITSAIIKYGIENFHIEKIYEASNIDELNEMEKYYISSYNSLSPNGYNLCTGGNNKRLSDETKKKISESNKGKVASEESKKKMSISQAGKVVSEETKKKLSDFFKGKKPSQNAIEASIEYNKKTYTLLNPEGILITFTNMKEFCKDNELSNSKLCLVASGKRKMHKGWTLPNLE